MKTQSQRDRDEKSGADIGEMLVSAGGRAGRGGMVCVHSALHSRHKVLSENIGKGAKVHGGGWGRVI